MVKFTTEAFVLIVSLCSQLSFAAAEIRITDGALAQKAFVPTSGAKERLLNFSLVFSVDCRRQHWLRSAYDDPPDKTKLSKKSSADTQRNTKTRRRAEDEPRWRSPWYVEPSDPATNDSQSDDERYRSYEYYHGPTTGDAYSIISLEIDHAFVAVLASSALKQSNPYYSWDARLRGRYKSQLTPDPL